MKVVLINGSGGSGKDTLVNLITTYLRFEFEIRNISTIDKVKKIAKEMGWDGKKDEAGRQFLADLKDVWTKYNNGANKETMNWIIAYHADEMISAKEFLVFVHCREAESLKWFEEELEKRKIDYCSILVKRDNIQLFQNSSDKFVENFNYDMTITNNGSLEDLDKISKELSEKLYHWEVRDINE